MGMGNTMSRGNATNPGVQALIMQFGGGRMPPEAVKQEANSIFRRAALKRRAFREDAGYEITSVDHLLEGVSYIAHKIERLVKKPATNPSKDDQDDRYNLDGMMQMMLQIIPGIQHRARSLPEILQEFERLKRLFATLPKWDIRHQPGGLSPYEELKFATGFVT
jgi:hypothetical protein